MKKEDFQTAKLIFPHGDWRCFMCRQENENLEVFAETEKEVCLICASCFQKNAQSVEFGLNDF